MVEVHGRARGFFRTGAALVFALCSVLAAGCDQNPAAPAHATDVQASFAMESDDIYWTGNVLEFVDGVGDTIRLERDVQQATEVDLYRNGTLLGSIDLEYVGTSVSGYRFNTPDGSQWLRTGSDGAIVETSVDGIGCEPSHEDPECPEPELWLFGDCDDQANAMQDSAWDAVAAGAAAIATGGPTNPIGKIATGIFVWKTVEALGDLLAYAACEIAS